jgi:hypothetical protein
VSIKRRWSNNKLSSSIASTRWMISGRNFCGSKTTASPFDLYPDCQPKASHFLARRSIQRAPARRRILGEGEDQVIFLPPALLFYLPRNQIAQNPFDWSDATIRGLQGA